MNTDQLEPILFHPNGLVKAFAEAIMFAGPDLPVHVGMTPKGRLIVYVNEVGSPRRLIVPEDPDDHNDNCVKYTTIVGRLELLKMIDEILATYATRIQFMPLRQEKDDLRFHVENPDQMFTAPYGMGKAFTLTA
jgi:hypothetical protein